MAIRKAMLAGACLFPCLFLFPAAASAQTAGPKPDGFARLPGKTALESFKAQAKARAAELRRNWLAHGHTLAGMDTPPKITAGKILTPKLNVAVAPAAPKISVKFRTNASGLFVTGAIFASSNGQQYIYASYQTQQGDPPITQGALKIQSPEPGFPSDLNLYSLPGVWTLADVDISDNAGNRTDYQGDDLKALFPNLAIKVTNNGTPDRAPPMVSAGEILTPVVRLSDPYPDFGATLTVSDDASGLGYYYMTVESPSGDFFYGFEEVPAPVLNGRVAAYVNLGDSTETGSWTIVDYAVCDLLFQCADDSDPHDIKALFGTNKFKVKN